MIRIFVHRDGQTDQATSIDRAWLARSSDAYLWVDLTAPSVPESLILSGTFLFHPLSVDDAMGPLQYPKLQAYEGYLYAILHSIDPQTGGEEIASRQLDFFVGPHFLVTVHDGDARPIEELVECALRNPTILGEGPVALLHRIADAIVNDYRPEVESLQQRTSELESSVFERVDRSLVHRLVGCRRAVGVLRRVAMAQRDVMSRLAGREFLDVSTEMAFRFRDVYDNLVRVVDDALQLDELLKDLLTVASGVTFGLRGRRWI